jgi:ribonucleotide monophosphatase NagD (HAD superfamily)
MPPIVVGEPERIMFDMASGCARIGVIGDVLITDIGGAKGAGLDAIWVLTGPPARQTSSRPGSARIWFPDSLAVLPDANRAMP